MTNGEEEQRKDEFLHSNPWYYTYVIVETQTSHVISLNFSFLNSNMNIIVFSI